MAEIRAVLLNDKNRVDYYENCPGCKIDQMKEYTHGITFKHFMFYVFVVVLAAETAVIGFWSGFTSLVRMTLLIALLSEYVVATIEGVSDSWGLSISFLSIILLPLVGNAAEHVGAIIFVFKNRLDITLGVALGSATQIAMFVVGLCVVVAWIMGIKMDLDFNILETCSLALSIAAFTLQDGTSHCIKGLVLLSLKTN